MAKPTHILVGTDFSQSAQAAVQTACEQARAFDARLTLVHVYPTTLELVDSQGTAAERIEIGTEVHRALTEVKKSCGDAVHELHAEVVAGDSPVQTLCELAAERGADLIVVGAHGRSGIASMLVGSTAERVARHAHCPVLIAR